MLKKLFSAAKNEEKNIFLILKLTLLLQCLGLLWNYYQFGGPLGSALFLLADWPDHLAYGLEFYLLILNIIFSLILFLPSFFLQKIIPLFISLFFFSYALSTYLLDESTSSHLALFTQALRFLFPLVLMTPNKFSFFSALLLKIFLSLTFIIHGIECFQLHPVFTDYVISFAETFLSYHLQQNHAEDILIIIGSLDIILGSILITSLQIRNFFPFSYHQFILIYMGLWGFITALERVIYSGFWGVGEFLVRTSHWGIPLVLTLYQKKHRENQKSLLIILDQR